MNNKILLFLSFLFALPSFSAKAFSAVQEIKAYENRVVESINITVENLPPGSSFDQKAVLSKLKTRVGDQFSELIFDNDLKTLADQFDRIEPSIQVQDDQKIFISIKLWVRPIIRSINWEGNHHIKTRTLRNELDVKPGTIFNRQNFNKAFNKVKEFYIKKGYFESQLQYELQIDSTTQEADILITVKEGRSGQVDNIIFKGFTKEEESDLLDMIYTKKYSLLTSWFTGMGTYHEELTEQDRSIIINYLQNKGYADANVDIFVLDSKSKGKIVLEICADRGIIYRFGAVTFCGNTLFPDEEIEKTFIARPEDIYSFEKIQKTAQAIKDLYGRKGYIDTSVIYETQLVEDEPVYNVYFQISEGDQFKIGLIHIIGNVQTQTHVILRESLLTPGEIFDSAKLKGTQQRLENVGYFKSVNVYAVRTQDDISLGENYRDVYIEVVETATGHASLFAGFSSADNLFGGLDITETNFNYKGITKLFKKGISAVRGGGEYLHLRLNFGVKQHNYSISWLTPYLMDTLWRFGFEFSQNHSNLQSKDYDIDTYNFSIYASYPFTRYWSFGTRYRIRNADIGVDHDVTKEEKKAVQTSGILSGVGTSLVYDSTNSALKPRNGLRSLLDGEFVGLGGRFTFFRFGFINNYYTPLWKYGIMKYRFEYRAIFPVWKTTKPLEIPISERFFLGGVASVRGFRDFDIGPHFSKTKDPTGGISSALISVEYFQDIFKFLGAFAFIDAGAVSLKHFNPGTFRMSYGVGIRLEVTNQVPIILGLGFPVNATKTNRARNFFFSMGGQF
ncbi:MAG: outer membrane protein assembly factor BamA [Chlamydiae bacterium]|nr:outer membrane protein assembly factor BamA [Chlamydiota bacterium]